MQIHQLKSNNLRKRARVGRGGKRGTFSGKGSKGQKSRAGHKIRPAERDLIQRLPKLRGFKNKPKSVKPAVINVGDLEKKMKSNEININNLMEAKLMGGSSIIKILGSGEVKKSFDVKLSKGIFISKGAKEKIEKAGGKVHE